jgi:hypothetical protein
MNIYGLLSIQLQVQSGAVSDQTFSCVEFGRGLVTGGKSLLEITLYSSFGNGFKKFVRMNIVESRFQRTTIINTLFCSFTFAL